MVISVVVSSLLYAWLGSVSSLVVLYVVVYWLIYFDSRSSCTLTIFLAASRSMLMSSEEITRKQIDINHRVYIDFNDDYSSQRVHTPI